MICDRLQMVEFNIGRTNFVLFRTMYNSLKKPDKLVYLFYSSYCKNCE